MDLLRTAYEEVGEEEESEEKLIPRPPSKRFRFGNPSPQPTTPWASLHRNSQITHVPKEVPIQGRYVSKRERALLEASSSTSNSISPCSDITSPLVGSISTSNVHPEILSSLNYHGSSRAKHGKLPEKLSTVLKGHTKAVNAIQWSPSHAHLLASAGMDHSVCVWNVWSRDGQKRARVFNFHNTAVKDVRWSHQGLFLLSCGYDCSSRLIDVEKGLQIQLFREDQTVGVIKYHPEHSDLFLSGGSKGLIRLWDIRVGKVVQEYNRGLGPILDVEFSLDAKHFISSADITNGYVSENAIIVWDVLRQVPLSNQVYAEAYTCPCIRYHPYEPFFVAQSNGNYIAIFSSTPPFRLDKYKRYEKHSVSGFPIKCGFNLDGDVLTSGSSDGCIYFYNHRSSELVRKIKASEQACIDVAYHPRKTNIIASCSWNGDVSVFELGD